MTNTMLIIWAVGTVLSLAVVYGMLRVWYAPEAEESEPEPTEPLE